MNAQSRLHTHMLRTQPYFLHSRVYGLHALVLRGCTHMPYSFLSQCAHFAGPQGFTCGTPMIIITSYLHTHTFIITNVIYMHAKQRSRLAMNYFATSVTIQYFVPSYFNHISVSNYFNEGIKN